MHAEEMAKEFCKRGIKSVAVYSNADGEFSEERNRAIEQLKNQEIKVIFSVDMFNEGVDIASLDMVMFLRPTESPTVFLQQLGRGLRISKGNWKDFPKVTSYEEYRKITDKQHLSKAKSMPIKFLKASCKGFFIDKDGCALGIRDELADVIKVDAFKKQMKDIIEYRTMEYYRRRYVEN